MKDYKYVLAVMLDDLKGNPMVLAHLLLLLVKVSEDFCLVVHQRFVGSLWQLQLQCISG